MSGGYILDKKLLEKRLEELAASPYGGERVWGAMCYSPACPGVGDYVCVVCNRTTKHTGGEFFVCDLIKCREIVNDLISHGYDVFLDEREFCLYCIVKGIDGEPKPHLNIRFDKNDNYIISKVGFHSLKLLQAFLIGDDHILGAYENTVPLHESIDILSKMTGFCEEEAKEWRDKVRRSIDPRYNAVKWRIDADVLEDTDDE